MGEGRHVAFTLAAGGARSRCVSFGRGSSLPAAAGTPVDAAVRLEVNRYNGAVEPRLVLRHARPARPAPIELVGEPAFLAGVAAELDRALEPWPPAPNGRLTLVSERPGDDATRASSAQRLPASSPVPAPAMRALRDARGTGIAGLLGDLVASGERVLVVCAHAGHRAAALRDRAGGFGVATWAALEDDPALAAPYAHVVAIDPPAHAHLQALFAVLPGDGWAHLAWGGAEQAFARRVHGWETDLRQPLADLYRALRSARAADGAALEALLRGDGTPARTGVLAGRLLRVLDDLGVIDIAREPLRVVVAADPPRTQLERSPVFLAYQRRLHDGMAWLEESGVPAVDRTTEEVAPRAA